MTGALTRELHICVEAVCVDGSELWRSKSLFVATNPIASKPCPASMLKSNIVSSDVSGQYYAKSVKWKSIRGHISHILLLDSKPKRALN